MKLMSKAIVHKVVTDAASQGQLSFLAYRLYHILASACWVETGAISQRLEVAEVAKELCASDRAVYRAAAMLRKAGFLSPRARGGNCLSGRLLLFVPLGDEVALPPPAPVDVKPPEPRVNGTGGSEPRVNGTGGLSKEEMVAKRARVTALLAETGLKKMN